MSEPIEVVLAEGEAKSSGGEQSEGLREPLGSGGDPGEQTRARGDRAGGHAEEDEKRQRALRFRSQERPGVQREESRDGGGCESAAGARHTRSLARSPMRPVGRSAISTITTAKAKTSL